MELILYDTEDTGIAENRKKRRRYYQPAGGDISKGSSLLDEERLLNELPDTDKTAIYGIQLLTVKDIFYAEETAGPLPFCRIRTLCKRDGQHPLLSAV